MSRQIFLAMARAIFLLVWVLVGTGATFFARDANASACRVVSVSAGDTLHIRQAPGSASPVVGTLSPDAHAIRITGEKRMVGAFSREVLPMLERDVLRASGTSCNETHVPGGQVVPPDGFKGMNFFLVLRMPEAGENELDWGAWAIGLEQWEGRYFLRYLVHYRWEP